MGSVSSFDNSSYELDKKSNEEENVFDDENKIKDAIEWGNVNNKIIITPAGNLEELEKQWVDFNSMIKKHRRESDWKSIEIFGMTNQDAYTKLKSSFMSNNIERYDNYDSIEDYLQSEDSPITESFAANDSEYTNITNAYYNKTTVVDYTEDTVKQAKEWAEEFNRFIITPTRTLAELENLWEAFQSMLIKHRRESDWKSIELFGMNNTEHYDYLKSNFLKENEPNVYDSLIKESSSVMKITDAPRMITNYLSEAVKTEPKVDIIKAVLELYAKNNSVYDEVLTVNGISDVLDRCDETITSIPEIVDTEVGDLPYISPEEMIDMGVYGQSPAENYYGELADNTNITDDITVKEWFKMYNESSKGYYSEFNNLSSVWVEKVRELSYGLESLKRTSNTSAINARKQSILELGWDPEIPFDERSRAIAKEIYKENAQVLAFNTKFIDLREFNTASKNDAKESEPEKTPLKPIFIVLTEGKALISKIIKKATKNIYSHSGISFDPELKNIYSFLTGGIQSENIETVKDGRRCGVYCFFVEDDKYDKIKENINYYIKNKEKTHYSVVNLLTYLFKIPLNMNWNMICSQFVDKMLKLAEIDISKKDPSQVSPADFSKILKENRKVYTIYKGLAEKYNGERTKKLVEDLARKAKPIREMNAMYFENEFNYIHGIINNIYDVNALNTLKEYSHLITNEKLRNALHEHLFVEIKPYAEAKEFPIQFDMDGNLLIRNLTRLNYEMEYAKSHKLLREYLNNANIDGIKYELAKLWMLNISIENKIYSRKHITPEVIGNYNKARAKILNDFKYFLNELLKLEPDFNFTSYYEASPFSSTTTKVSHSTMTGFSNLVKTFIKPL